MESFVFALLGTPWCGPLLNDIWQGLSSKDWQPQQPRPPTSKDLLSVKKDNIQKKLTEGGRIHF